MRIAINGLAVEPGRPGGDVTYVRELVRWLPRVAPDIEWLVFTSSTGRALFPPDSDVVRYIICPIRGQSLVARALWEQITLPRFIRRVDADVLHAPINVSPLAAKLPVVLTLHEAEPFMPENRIPLPLLAWWRVLRAQSARTAARVLAVSYSAKGDLVRWMGVPESKVDVVHLGVDTQRFTPRPAAENPPLGGMPYILWIGRPYPGKNLGRLISAFAMLWRGGRQEHLVLLGPTGWAEQDIAAAAEREGCAEALVRVPAVWDDLPRWYRGCAAFVYPSTRESFGLPVLEAMACGVPVLAADIPALREVGGDSVAYADPFQPEHLAGVLRRILTDDAFSCSLQRAGPARSAQFTWNDTARLTCDQLRAASTSATMRTR